MWIKSNNKTFFLDLDEYFLNLDNIEKEVLKKIVADSKTNEVLKLRLSNGVIPDLRAAFSLLDYEARGTVGLRDIKVILRALGMEPTAEKVRRLAALSSTDERLELSAEEFERMFQLVLNDVDSENQAVRAFRAFDAGGGGCVTFDDLREAARRLQLDVGEEEMREMILFADPDNVGRVSQADFVEAARKIF